MRISEETMAFIYLAILRRLKLNYELRTFAYIIDRSFLSRNSGFYQPIIGLVKI